MEVTIDNLPNHVLGTILNNCSPEEKCRLSTVCPKWKSVLDKYFGVIMVTGTADGVSIEQIEGGDSRLRIPKRYEGSLSALDLLTGSASLNETGDCKTPPEVTTEELQSMLKISGEYVQKLSFVGGLPIHVPLSVMNMCNNISGLHFHLSSLAAVASTLPLTIDIPTLKTFVVDSVGIWGLKEKQIKSLQHDNDELTMKELMAAMSTGWYSALDEIFKVIVGLLTQNHFQHLETVVLDLPYYSDQKEGILTAAISTFLAKHAESLRSFCYNQGFPAMLEAEEERHEEEEDFLSLSKLAQLSTEMKGRNVSLKEFHVGLLNPQETDPLWKNLILFQDKLEVLVFTGDQMPFPAFTLKHNAKTLKKVTLDVRDLVDLQALEGCAQLVSLSLQGKRDKDFSDSEDESWITAEGHKIQFPQLRESKLMNLDKLPKSLQTFRVHGISLDTEVLDEVICNPAKWTGIKGLEFIDCGNENKFGISIKAIAHVLQERKLQWFRFDYSLNRRSVYDKKLPESVQNLAILLSQNSISNFKVRGFLNKLGRYVQEQRLEGQQLSPEVLEGAQGNWREIGVRLMEPDVFAFPEVLNPTGAYRHILGVDDGLLSTNGEESTSDEAEGEFDSSTSFSTDNEDQDHKNM